MSSPIPTQQGLGLMALLCGFVLEAAAALPWLAPEVVWIDTDQIVWLHIIGALVGASGAAALFSAKRGFGQWAGATLFFAIFAVVIPGLGLLAVFVLAVVLLSHHAQEEPVTVPFAKVRPRRVASRLDGSLYSSGPLAQPLVSMIDEFGEKELREIVLGLESMPPRRTRPILQRLQRHPDVRVQLYANGLLNDQVDVLERRLSVLKDRVAARPEDQDSQTAIIEVYLGLFENRMVANDEVAQIAKQALQETVTALAANPANPIALSAQAEFHLLRGEFEQSAFAIAQLRQVPGQAAHAARLDARLRFDRAAALHVAEPPPAPDASSQERPRSAR